MKIYDKVDVKAISLYKDFLDCFKLFKFLGNKI